MVGLFFISRCYEVSGVGLILAGIVENGEITEGAIGMTSRGKKFVLVKIEKQGEKILKAGKKQRVNLFVKNVTRADISKGEFIHFG